MNGDQPRQLGFKVHLRLNRPLDPATYEVLICQTDRYAAARGLCCGGGGSATELHMYFSGTSTRNAMEFERAAMGKRFRALPMVADMAIGQIVDADEEWWWR